MKFALMTAVAATALFTASAASANTIDWTQWGTFTTGVTGATANGVVGATTVTYSGEVDNLFFGYPSWGPLGSFSGGTVGNAPPSAGGIIQLTGGSSTGTDTITFGVAVLNPVIAIWSLGSEPPNANAPAELDFSLTPTIEAGGPSNEYAGQSITLTGDNANGAEGNGVVQFTGTFKTITFTTPNPEYWYGFTVGYTSAVPEPATWAMFLLGFGAVGFAMRSSRRASKAVTA